jgi:hypothetical protein
MAGSGLLFQASLPVVAKVERGESFFLQGSRWSWGLDGSGSLGAKNKSDGFDQDKGIQKEIGIA